MEIWVNPACSKCRAATSTLDEAGVEYTVRRYLDEPPTAAELTAVLHRLGLEPWHITRTGEPVAKEIGLAGLPQDAEHRDRRLRSEHSRQVRSPAGACDDEPQAPAGCGFRVREHVVGHAMRGNDPRLGGHTERVQLRDRVLHHVPVVVASHDDAD